jgi:hypothetical protein
MPGWRCGSGVHPVAETGETMGRSFERPVHSSIASLGRVRGERGRGRGGLAESRFSNGSPKIWRPCTEARQAFRGRANKWVFSGAKTRDLAGPLPGDGTEPVSRPRLLDFIRVL